MSAAEMEIHDDGVVGGYGGGILELAEMEIGRLCVYEMLWGTEMFYG